jgi:hypothetical protein
MAADGRGTRAVLKQLGWCVALMVLIPAAAEAQQSTMQVRVIIHKGIETQRVVPSTPDADARLAVPSSWRWQVRSGGAETSGASWSTAPLAAGRGGEVQQGYALEGESGDVSYVFTPL